MSHCNKLSQFILFFTLLASIQTSFADNSLTLGVHPYKSPKILVKAYKPLIDYLKVKLNRPIKMTISKNYDLHIREVGMDNIDIAYLGPASYVKMVNLFGEKRILARQAINSKPTFQGKIIIRSDSDISSIEQLKGKRFAFGDPDSTMSHLVPHYMLIKKGITADSLEKHSFLGSHDNVALGVLTGDYHAGAVKEAVFYKYQSRGIKALATTPALSEHLFVASNALPQKTVDTLRSLLLSLKDMPQGKGIMTSIKSNMTSMMKAKNNDYHNLRDILNTLEQANIIK